jgi:pentatricopeptide repeat protein
MAIRKVSSHYERGLKLAQASKYLEALVCIQEHLCTAPDDGQALNDAGAILYCLGRADEAIDHFVKAKGFQGDSAEILWNLVEAYLGAGRADEAVQLFDDMERLGILTSDVLNRTANVLLAQDNKAGAIEMLHHSLEIAPGQKILEPMINVICSKMPKVAFVFDGKSMGLPDEMIECIRQRFQVRLFEGQMEEELCELMEWSDICWFEPDPLVVAASKLPKVCTNIVRLGHYEAYKQWPRQVDWSNIDILVTVGDSFIRDALVQRIHGLESQTSIVSVPNGVNLEQFAFRNHQRGKNIAFLANLRMLKNPAFVLQCMQKLHYIDPEYRLFFGGEFADSALEQYLKHLVDSLGLRDVVFFDGRQEDVNSWLEDKHYIVSTSIIESQSRGILEGMACGLKPVIHNFPGAGQMLPSEFLFNISEEFCEQICSDKYEPQRYRRFVEENYPLENQLKEINDIFKQLESGSVIHDSGPEARSVVHGIPIAVGLSQITDREAIKQGF